SSRLAFPARDSKNEVSDGSFAMPTLSLCAPPAPTRRSPARSKWPRQSASQSCPTNSCLQTLCAKCAEARSEVKEVFQRANRQLIKTGYPQRVFGAEDPETPAA